MPAKKKTTRSARPRKTTARAKATPRRARSPRKGRSRFETTWKEALRALEGAEKQAEKEIRGFIKRSKLDTRQASALWKRWNARLDRESRKAARNLEVGLADLQTRARKESRAFGRMVDEAVQGALGALNIPSRQEVQQLTRKVNQLSRKIDGFRR
jgi:Poly(hydroxyalcanoate) granule associated protein (phasin)